MPILATSPSPPARAPAIAATLAVHLLLVALWFGAQAPRPRVAHDGPRIQWVVLAPPVPAMRSRPPPPPSPAPARSRANAPAPAAERAPARATAMAPQHSPSETAAAAPLVLVPTPAVAPPGPPAAALSADGPARGNVDVLAQARRDIGKIAIELGKEKPGLLHAPLNNAQTRLAAGIDKATRAPHLFEAPRVELVQDQGGYDRRIYKVKGALGTYCITIESNHAPDGLDTMKNGIQPKLTTCPREE